VETVERRERNPLQIVTVPGVYDGQALALHSRSAKLASVSDVRFAGIPARPGDPLSIFTSGLSCWENLSSVRLLFGDRYASIRSIARVDATPELCRIDFEAPDAAASPQTPMSIMVMDATGGIRLSNTASVALEDGSSGTRGGEQVR
jgi:hypothetical protein